LWLSLLTVTAICTLLCHRYFKFQLGGYSGDLLGASQQLTEVSLYLCWLLVSSRSELWLQR